MEKNIELEVLENDFTINIEGACHPYISDVKLETSNRNKNPSVGISFNLSSVDNGIFKYKGKADIFVDELFNIDSKIAKDVYKKLKEKFE